MNAEDATLAAEWKSVRDAQVRQRLIDHLASGTTAFGMECEQVPPAFYTDSARLDAERAGVFGQRPLLACLSQDIPNPGDQFLFEALDTSIVILRHGDGGVRAYLNMCAHRAAKLVTDCAPRKRLTCPFHGWTFNLDGKLIGLPGRKAFDPAELEQRSLYSVPVEEWAGMVFIKTKPGNERFDVCEYLGGLANPLRALRLEEAHPAARGRLDYQANWKYALDTYCEGYHVNVLHARTLKHRHPGDCIDIELHGPHHAMLVPSALLISNPTGFTETADFRSGADVGYSPVFFIYPNTVLVLNITPGENRQPFVITQRLFPGDGVGSGYVLNSTYKSGGPLAGDEADFVAAHNMVMQVVGEEDFSVAEGGQRNLRNAPADFRPLFGRCEFAASNVHRHLAVDAGLPF